MPTATGSIATSGSALADVSVIIVNWNAGPGLLRAAKAAAATGAEVIVVDNASSDGSADDVAARLPAVRVLRERANLGFAGGTNLGAQVASGRWLLLLNPDAVISASALTVLRDALGHDSLAAAVGACLVGGDGRPQAGFTLRRFPTLLSLATDLLLIDELWPSNPVRRRYLALDVALDGESAVEADQPAAACLLARAEAFRQLGGFDERFRPAWFEDVDFCRRVRDAGWRVLFAPHARVPHEGGVSLRTLGRVQFSRFYYRNMRRYVLKHHGHASRLVLWCLIGVGMAARLAFALLTGSAERQRASWVVLRDLFRPIRPARR
jgi:GT2 family glycosyltransferase